MSSTKAQIAAWAQESCINNLLWHLKKEVSPNNKDWVSGNNFRNLKMKFWANMDIPFKSYKFEKLCLNPYVALSRW